MKTQPEQKTKGRTPFLVCIADNAGKGSMVTRRKTLRRAQRAARELVDVVRRPLGIWNDEVSEWQWATCLPLNQRQANALAACLVAQSEGRGV